MELNPNIQFLKESATLKINQQVLSDRSQGKPIIHFGFGESPFPVPLALQKELGRQAHQNHYLPTRGLLPLRKCIAEYYQKKWKYNFLPEQILIGPGSKELIFQALFILRGDVLIPAPSWVSYGPQVLAMGRQFHTLICHEKDHYKLRADTLSDYCRSLGHGQKVLIMNSPHNPTGAVYEDDEIASIVEVCRKQNIIIISDEIYKEVDFSDRIKKGVFSLYPEGTVVTSGISKAQSSGGWRLGFLAASSHFNDFLLALSTMISETYSSVSAPIQYAAMTAYSDHPEVNEQVALCRKIHACTGKYMAKRFLQMGASVCPPQGAFYLFPHLNRFKDSLEEQFKVKTSLQLVNLIYKKIQLALLPASDFYMPEDFLAFRAATVDYDGPAVLLAARRSNQLDHRFVKEHCPRITEGMDRLEDFLSCLQAK